MILLNVNQESNQSVRAGWARMAMSNQDSHSIPKHIFRNFLLHSWSCRYISRCCCGYCNFHWFSILKPEIDKNWFDNGLRAKLQNYKRHRCNFDSLTLSFWISSLFRLDKSTQNIPIWNITIKTKMMLCLLVWSGLVWSFRHQIHSSWLSSEVSKKKCFKFNNFWGMMCVRRWEFGILESTALCSR